MKNYCNIELDDRRSAFCKYYLQQTGINPDRFHWDIHPEDEMFYKAILPGIYEKSIQKAYLKYLESGKRTLDVVEQIVQYCFSSFRNLGKLLEFACGHGRFSRYLVQKMPSDNVWASDIYQSAVEWQKYYFGVNAIQSCADPNDFFCDEKFSFILVGSLFSHLPDTAFKAWLKTMYDLLDDRGVLAFSVRDEDQLRNGQTMGKNGIVFSRESESSTLSHDLYGLTQVTNDYVTKSLNELVAGGRQANYAHFKKALYENQALYIVARDHSIDLSGLDLKITPIGGVMHNFVNERGERVINGWGIDLNPGKQISEVQLLVNNKVMSTCEPVLGNYDVLKYFPKAPNAPVAWSLIVEDKKIQDNNFLTCRMKSQSGSKIIFFL